MLTTNGEKKNEELISADSPKETTNDRVMEPEFLQGVVLKLDDLIQREKAGCTAIFAVIKKHSSGGYEFTVGNVGDSRAILIKKKDGSVIDLSVDHKPTLPSEIERIQNAGGFVRHDRVQGCLALSRAIGDHIFKDNEELPPHQQKVIAVPDFMRGKAEEGDTIALYCDGIVERHEVFNNPEVGAFLHPLIYTQKEEEESDLALAASKLIRHCLSLSRDNMSVILIQLKDGSSYHQEKEEFVPGPILNSTDTKYMKSYKANCEYFGHSFEEAVDMLKKTQLEPHSSNLDEDVVVAKDGEKVETKPIVVNHLPHVLESR